MAWRLNIFETYTETFFRDRDRYSQKSEKSLDTEKSRDEMSHSGSYFQKEKQNASPAGKLCSILSEKSALKGFTLQRHADFAKCTNTCDTKSVFLDVLASFDFKL